MDVIALKLNEVHAKRAANIEEAVSRLDSEVQDLKTRTTKLEKNVEELEEGFQYNEDDVTVTFNVTTRNRSMKFMT